MARYRTDLPQTNGKTLLGDGGLETTLIFHQGVDLPDFAAFALLETTSGRDRLKGYYRDYLEIASRYGTGFLLDTPTWRANPDWGQRLGYDAAGLRRINRTAIDLMLDLREEFETDDMPCVIGGVIGPRGDGYKAGQMSADEAALYHEEQISTFAATEADMITAYTISAVEEAVGIARSAERAGMPCAISFTVETDGRLAGGPAIGEAIEATDRKTGRTPAYYMINCAHPEHFRDHLNGQAGWMSRVLGIKANASRKSHAELDQSSTLDEGDPVELGAGYADLGRRMPHLKILGGCCGTDSRHIAAVCEAVFSSPGPGTLRGTGV